MLNNVCKFLLLGAFIVFPVEAYSSPNSNPICSILANYDDENAGVTYDSEGEGYDIDLNAAPDAVYDVIQIPVAIDFAAQITQNLPAGFLAEGNVAMMEIHKNGDVFYNGTNLTAQARAACNGEMPQQNTQQQGASSAPQSRVLIDGKPFSGETTVSSSPAAPQAATGGSSVTILDGSAPHGNVQPSGSHTTTQTPASEPAGSQQTTPSHGPSHGPSDGAEVLFGAGD